MWMAPAPEAASGMMRSPQEPATDQEPSPMRVVTIGLDLAKMVCSQRTNSA